MHVCDFPPKFSLIGCKNTELNNKLQCLRFFVRDLDPITIYETFHTNCCYLQEIPRVMVQQVAEVGGISEFILF